MYIITEQRVSFLIKQIRFSFFTLARWKRGEQTEKFSYVNYVNSVFKSWLNQSGKKIIGGLAPVVTVLTSSFGSALTFWGRGQPSGPVRAVASYQGHKYRAPSFPQYFSEMTSRPLGGLSRLHLSTLESYGNSPHIRNWGGWVIWVMAFVILLNSG